jgi:hypothetical protein
MSRFISDYEAELHDMREEVRDLVIERDGLQDELHDLEEENEDLRRTVKFLSRWLKLRRESALRIKQERDYLKNLCQVWESGYKKLADQINAQARSLGSANLEKSYETS